MAKTANQRLRQLEKSGLAGSSPAYRYIERLDFENRLEAGTVPFITATRKGQLKFSTSTGKLTAQQLQREYEQLQKFLTAKTSTVTGTKKTLDKSREAFNRMLEKSGKIPWTREQYADRAMQPLLDSYYNMFGSQEFNEMLSAGYSAGLDDTQIARLLDKIGMFENMTKDRADSEGIRQKIYRAFDEWQREGHFRNDYFRNPE